MNIKAVLFDMDGVLIDNDKYEEEVIQYILQQISIREKISTSSVEQKMNDFLKKHYGKKEWFDWRLLGKHFGFEKIWVEASLVNLNFLKLIDGAQELLENVCGKYKLAVASNAIQEIVDIKLGYFGLLHYFDYLFSQDSHNTIKSDEQYFKGILKTLNLKVQQVVLVEDRPSGIKTAAKLGINTIYLPYGYKICSQIQPVKEGDISADFVAKNLNDVLLFLKNLH